MFDYSQFAAPDGSKPIIDIENEHQKVTVIVLDGSNALNSGDDHLAFVESGTSQEWLTPSNATRKFVQDSSGQVFYYPHGVEASAELKPVDVIGMGT